MKRYLVLGFFLLSTLLRAQTSATLTGTVTDSDGTLWAKASWTYTLTNPSGGPLVNICGTTLHNSVTGQLSTVGTFASGSLVTNQCISPGGTQWQLTICAVTSAPCQTLPARTINVSSYNAGAFADSFITAPRFPISGIGFGYTTGEVNTPITVGSFLFITTPGASCTVEIWDGGAWICGATSGGITQLTGDGTAGPGTGSQVFAAVDLPGHVALTGTAASGKVPTATDATHATWQTPSTSAPSGCPTGAASNAICYQYPNDPAGTGLNLLACLQGTFHQQTIATCPANVSSTGTDNNPAILGVVVAGAGTTGNATVQVAGDVSLKCDTTVVADGTGYWVQPSITVAGECHQPTGGFAPSPNENPEGNTVLGRAVVANTGADTVAVISLLPFGSYATGAPAGINGGFYTNFALEGDGGEYISMSHIYQAPSTDPIPYAIVTPGLCFPESGSSHCGFLGQFNNGVSGNDITFDLLSHGQNSPPDEMVQFVGGQYQQPSNCFTTPAPCSGSGTFVLGNHNSQFDVGNSTGLYVLNLTGDATTFTPLATDNFGHILTFVITPNAHTWTFPAGTPGFINAGTVANSSVPIITQFFFDGTNYQCMLHCAPVVAGWTSGSNSNGQWVKNPVGTINQWQPTPITIGNDTTVTFPVAYTDATSIQITPAEVAPIGDVGYCFVIQSSITTTVFHMHSANQTTEACTYAATGH